MADVSYGGENGFNQAIDLSSEILAKCEVHTGKETEYGGLDVWDRGCPRSGRQCVGGGDLNVCSVRSDIERTESGSETSAQMRMARWMEAEEEELIFAARPSASTELDSTLTELEEKTREMKASREARWRAAARPMLWLAPVTMATRPFKEKWMECILLQISLKDMFDFVIFYLT